MIVTEAVGHKAKRSVSWDPTPGTGWDYLGEFDELIPANVDGTQRSSLFPHLAKQADKYSLIASLAVVK